MKITPTPEQIEQIIVEELTAYRDGLEHDLDHMDEVGAVFHLNRKKDAKAIRKLIKALNRVIKEYKIG